MERASQRSSARSSKLNAVQGGRSSPSVALRSRADSLKGNQLGNGKPKASRSASSNASNGFAKNSPRVDLDGGSQRNSNGLSQGREKNGARRSSQRPKEMSREELLSLLFRKPQLKEMRPEMHRLDLSQRDDLRFLYEMQHRVDPELVPVRNRMYRANWNKMHQSHIFDTETASSPQASAKPVKKHDDGLGSIARFVLCSEERGASPLKGRRHGNYSAGRTTLRLFDGNPKKAESRATSPNLRTGVRMVGLKPADKLGANLQSLDPLCEVGASRHGVRTRETVEMFESTQPKLTLPPQKLSRRHAHPARSFSASDNDIFGVRKRRERMMRRVPSCSSARTSEPYGSEDLERSTTHRQSSLGSTSLIDEKRSNHSTIRSKNVPFGEEEPRNSGTPTRHQRSRRGGSLASRGSSVAPSSSVHSWSHVRSTRGSNSEGLRRRKDVIGRQRNNTSAATVSSKASVLSESVESSASLFPTPRVRTGRARVPGHSITKSNIVFGDVNVVNSPRHVQQRNW
ncbi:hypothetical protein MOQ_005895 [Trypanosoma cruzi marinkellei]|uniref:Uncharacterized protein n=1 Tax=Trypanosoma cruzi marinkellei TaxID=85056 RepID=K2M5V5_TRYCR|nr:hypothetical protein MOQ_005895 [Trypanosoma cruzi marinkellei]